MKWLKSVAAAFITGVSNGIVAGIVSPDTFNATPEGLEKFAWMIGLSGLLGAATYIKQSPFTSDTA